MMKHAYGLLALSIITAGFMTCLSIDPSPIHAGGLQSTLHRETQGKGVDSSSGRLIIRIPSDNSASGDNSIPSEAGSPAAEPSGPRYRGEGDPPTFYGEVTAGTSIFVIDNSNSMTKRDTPGSIEDDDGNVIATPSRLDVVKIQTIRTIKSMSEDDLIAIVELSGNTNHWLGSAKEDPPCCAWPQSLQPVDETNRSQLVDYVTNLKTRLGTPAYTALKVACEQYGSEIDQMFYLTDGAPTSCDVPGWDGAGWDYEHAQSVIIEQFGTWFAPLQENGCTITCIEVGSNSHAQQYLTEFASAYNAKYVRQ